MNIRKSVQIGSCNGVCKFRVHKKSGEQYFYGFPESARQNLTGPKTATVQWSLNEIKDSVNNFIRFIYEEDAVNNTHKIKRISYGGNGGIIAGSVDFKYKTRLDPMQQYMHGALIRNTKILDTVDVKASNYSIVRQYRLEYRQSLSNNRTLLASLKECNGYSSTADCLKPTEFTWYGDTSAFSSWNSNGNSFPGQTLDKCRRMTQGDVNGDGRTDVICIYDTDNDKKGWVITYVQFATDNGYGAWSSEYNKQHQDDAFDPSYCGLLRAADFNGDGLTDLVCNIGNYFNVQLSQGNAFGPWHTWASSAKPSCIHLDVSDVNADGRSDIVCVGVNKTHVLTSTGAGFTDWQVRGDSANSIVPIGNNCEYQSMGDINGDGLSDIICIGRSIYVEKNLCPISNTDWFYSMDFVA